MFEAVPSLTDQKHDRVLMYFDDVLCVVGILTQVDDGELVKIDCDLVSGRWA